MTIPKKYFHDRLILLLLSLSVFLTVFTSVWVVLQLNSGTHTSEEYITRYIDQGAIGTYTHGNVADILGFIGFTIIVLLVQVFMSIRVYRIHRHLAVVVLALGFLLLVLSLIVSNALLALH